MAIGFPLFIPLIGADEGGLIGGHMVRDIYDYAPYPLREAIPFPTFGERGVSPAPMMTLGQIPRKGKR